MRHLKSVLIVLGAVTILVVAANAVALAATGQALLLGKGNTASTATGITRSTSGSVLALHAKSASDAPLSVDSGGKVTNLNADRLDGLDSATLKNSTRQYGIPGESGVNSFAVDFPSLPAGLYLATYSITVATNPVGCEFQFSSGSSTGLAYGAVLGNFSNANASAIVDTRSDHVSLYCFAASGTMTLTQNNPTPQVSFTRLDSVITATATDAARKQAPRTSTTR
jgi:hypothetical protein